MQQRLRKPSKCTRRKAQFREEARSIVRDDREKRRWGASVDTGGAIARALERAYAMGFRAAQMDNERPDEVCEDPDAPMDWYLIPPRPRAMFRSIGNFCVDRRDNLYKVGGFLREIPTERLTPGWQIISSNGQPWDVYGQRTAVPLIKLGLLKSPPNRPDRLFMTQKGLATWVRRPDGWD